MRLNSRAICSWARQGSISSHRELARVEKLSRAFQSHRHVAPALAAYVPSLFLGHHAEQRGSLQRSGPALIEDVGEIAVAQPTCAGADAAARQDSPWPILRSNQTLRQTDCSQSPHACVVELFGERSAQHAGHQNMVVRLHSLHLSCTDSHSDATLTLVIRVV
jgi:hypothetical protein